MRLFRIFLILVICASCKQTVVNKGDDTLSYNVESEEFTNSSCTTEDTIIVLKDIAKCDSLIGLEKDNNMLFMLYQKKVNLLTRIGKVRDVYFEQGKAMELLPKEDVRRLEYEAIGAYLQHDLNRYSQLLNKAINECKKEPYDAAMILNQATFYTLLGNDEASKAVMENYLKNNDDEAISYAYEDYPHFKKQILEGRTTLIKLLQTED